MKEEFYSSFNFQSHIELYKVFLLRKLISSNERISLSKNLLLFQEVLHGFKNTYEQDFLLDEIFGYDISKIEQDLVSLAKQILPDGNQFNLGKALHGKQTWIGLNYDTLSTSYLDFHQITKNLNLPQNARVLDVGCGYARFAIVLRALRPDVEFVGLEIVKERAQEARKVLKNLKCHNSKIIEIDVLNDAFKIEGFHALFCYDFSDQESIRLLLNKIFKSQENSPNIVLVAKGEMINKLIQEEHTWLKSSQSLGPYLKIYKTL